MVGNYKGEVHGEIQLEEMEREGRMTRMVDSMREERGM